MDRFEVKFATDDLDAKTGEFSGYGAVFGNADYHDDVIVPGAFRQTLRDWKKEKRLPPMLSQHGGWSVGDMDGLPIGVWTEMDEDDKGLAVKGRIINLDTERGKTIYGAMKEGALGGLSIGYMAKKFTLGTKPGEPRRKLEAVELVELSVVTSPANRLARIGSVKTARQITTVREFEDFLRDAGGFSHAAAKAIASRGFKAAEPRDEDEADLAALLRRNIATLSTR
jgi:uncharacterized protein